MFKHIETPMQANTGGIFGSGGTLVAFGEYTPPEAQYNPGTGSTPSAGTTGQTTSWKQALVQGLLQGIFSVIEEKTGVDLSGLAAPLSQLMTDPKMLQGAKNAEEYQANVLESLLKSGELDKYLQQKGMTADQIADVKAKVQEQIDGLRAGTIHVGKQFQDQFNQLINGTQSVPQSNPGTPTTNQKPVA